VSLFVGVALLPEAGDTVDKLIERSRAAAYAASPGAAVVVAAASAGVPLNRDAVSREDFVVGEATREAFETVARVAAFRIPVLLHGATGTGKEVLARLLHEGGPRRARRLVRVNCGAIPKDLVESMLFGHERGAFTGAIQQQKGVFEDADGGTVFLDEIGELPLSVQVALLRVLETSSFCRVGSTREISVDVRLATATHRDLEGMIEAGTFRADLYYRLCGVVIEIPPLRERADEIDLLARRFLAGVSAANGLSLEGFAPEALARLRAYPWPGNIRELRNAIERAAVVARGPLIQVDDLPVRIRASSSEVAPRADASAPAAPDAGATAPLPAAGRKRVQSYEAKMLHEALEASGWVRAEAARRLNLPVRTLSYRMKVLGITKPGS